MLYKRKHYSFIYCAQIFFRWKWKGQDKVQIIISILKVPDIYHNIIWKCYIFCIYFSLNAQWQLGGGLNYNWTSNIVSTLVCSFKWNTSLAAPGAFARHLERKMATGGSHADSFLVFYAHSQDMKCNGKNKHWCHFALQKRITFFTVVL